MNISESKMLDILRKGREEYGIIAVKAEFEEEGSRTKELLKLSELTYKSGLEFAFKIGGCGAIRDLNEVNNIGARYVIAPMIESSYSLLKYISAIEHVFSLESKNNISFLFNIETITAFNNINEIVELASQYDFIRGIVFGRDDFSKSIGIGSSLVEHESITSFVNQTGQICFNNNMDFVVGGGVTFDSIDNLIKIHNQFLTRFETRKIVFQSSILESANIKNALSEALYFELLWLYSKRENNQKVSNEDSLRIQKLENICSLDYPITKDCL